MGLLAESLQEIRQHQILLEEDLHRDVMQLRLSIEQACDQEISDLKLNSVSSKEGWNKEKLEMEEERVDSEVWSIRDKWHRVLTQRVEERMELDRVQLRKWSEREQMVLIELDNAMMELKDEEKKEEEKKEEEKKEEEKKEKEKEEKNRNQDNQDRDKQDHFDVNRNDTRKTSNLRNERELYQTENDTVSNLQAQHAAVVKEVNKVIQVLQDDKEDDKRKESKEKKEKKEQKKPEA